MGKPDSYGFVAFISKNKIRMHLMALWPFTIHTTPHLHALCLAQKVLLRVKVEKQIGRYGVMRKGQ